MQSTICLACHKIYTDLIQKRRRNKFFFFAFEKSLFCSLIILFKCKFSFGNGAQSIFFQGFHYQSLGKCYWFANVLTNYTLLVVERFQLPSYIINITKGSVAFHIYCFAMRKVVVTYSHVLYLGHFIWFMNKCFAWLAGLEIKLRTCLIYQALWSRKCTWNMMALTLLL